MSFLSIYHLEIAENFEYYSKHFKGYYKHDANQQIVL
jgi:hypothetical protein